MDTTDLTYPVFEPNQVLTNAHLNELFEYLDEQTRLTRSNLIGIGIACGLEVDFEAPGTVHLTRGCGVTSQGYLIVEPTDLALAYVRPYKLPTEYGYEPFIEPGTDPAKQRDLWELFPDDDEPGAQSLATSGLVLEDKAVLLFLELRKDDLRNCRPNSCDDHGAEVTATVRRLLIDVADLNRMIEATSAGDSTYLAPDLTDRVALPDLRMPRVDVPNTGPVEPNDVLFAFQAVFRQNGLVAATAAALKQLYNAFKPLVRDDFPNEPFAATFTNRFGFLDATPATTAQVRFMQYYWDLFDDLLAAYDEARWAGLDLMCACCPPEGLFPRHLMAGVLDATAYDPADYRHHFVPSPAVGDCEDRTRAVRLLFHRLVAIAQSFTDTPPDKGVRITPSRWGEAPMSAKAIPYYYDQDGTPPAFELWDPVKTARTRANQNLSYRADEFTPPPPAFVTDPLRFDLEPNNFLRIEGHLGKNVQSVLETLLTVRKSHRLPFEVVALRTGAFDENVDVDLSKKECRFQDLDTLYETLKSELTCFLVKQVQYFHKLPAERVAGDEPIVPRLELLRRHAPEFIAEPGTVGYQVEELLAWKPGQPPRAMFTLAGARDLPSQVLALVGAMSDLSARLTDDLRDIDFTAFANSYNNLVEIARRTEELRRSGAFDQPGLAERLDDIVFRCRLDPFEAMAEEFERRVRDVKQAQYLSHFLERHPGIQHKAGVPLGGTFVVVYHALPATGPGRTPATGEGNVVEVPGRVRSRGPFKAFELGERESARLSDALARLQYKVELAEDPDVQLVYTMFTGNVLVPKRPASKFAEQVYLEAVSHMPDGTVIADFFLPYECCSDCAPISYTLPPTRLRVTMSKECTNADGFAAVTLTAEAASGALSAQVDDGAFEEAAGPLLLGVGEHKIVVRDATGDETSPLEITIPPQLVIGATETTVDRPAGTYHVVFEVEGGSPPYVADPGAVVDTTYRSPTLAVTDVLTVVIKDAAGCTVEGRFHSDVPPCELPCDGVAERAGHRFWLPEARPNFPINDYRAEVRTFVIMDPGGNPVDLTPDANSILVRAPNPIRSTDYARVVQRWLDAINKRVSERVGSDQWFRVEYEPAPETGTTGSLFVDRLTCLDFNLDLEVRFNQGQRERRFELLYNSGGTVVVDEAGESKFRIPPFGMSTSNNCRPDEPPVPRCEGTDLEVEFRRKGAVPDSVVLMAAVSGNDKPVAFLWEVQDGIPSVAGGQQSAFRFESPEPIEKVVRLTAFTERGCTVTHEQVINIAKRDG